MDLTGRLPFVSCFEMAAAVGFHVRSLPKGERDPLTHPLHIVDY
jgi:hypothetical protein